MKSTNVGTTVTNNEDFVRLRIFDGLLPSDDYFKELYELEKSQRLALWKQHLELRDKYEALLNDR